jgi:hypothetical protein
VFKVQNVGLEALHPLYLPSFQVALEMNSVDLVNGQPAQVILCLVDHLLFIVFIDLQQSVGSKLGLTDYVFIPLVEHEMQDPLCLHLNL